MGTVFRRLAPLIWVNSHKKEFAKPYRSLYGMRFRYALICYAHCFSYGLASDGLPVMFSYGLVSDGLPAVMCSHGLASDGLPVVMFSHGLLIVLFSHGLASDGLPAVTFSHGLVSDGLPVAHILSLT